MREYGHVSMFPRWPRVRDGAVAEVISDPAIGPHERWKVSVETRTLVAGPPGSTVGSASDLDGPGGDRFACHPRVRSSIARPLSTDSGWLATGLSRASASSSRRLTSSQRGLSPPPVRRNE